MRARCAEDLPRTGRVQRRLGVMCAVLGVMAIAPEICAHDVDLSSCLALSDDRRRLACYDAIARDAVSLEQTGPELPPGPDARNDEQSAAGTAEFGRPARDPAPGVDSITARVTEVSMTSLGRRVITLDNGQVWMENEPGRARVRAGDDVTVSRHLLRFSLRVASGGSLAVHRIE